MFRLHERVGLSWWGATVLNELIYPLLLAFLEPLLSSFIVPLGGKIGQVVRIDQFFPHPYLHTYLYIRFC